MQAAKSASVRVLAPLGVALVAVAVLVVIATSLGGDGSNGGGRDGRGDGGGQKKERTGEKVYVVEPGDTLTTISDKTGVGVDKLSRLNPDLDPQALISGERVKLR
jgi:LysM repeat protein